MEELKLKLDKNTMLLYAITDRTWLREYSLVEQVEETVKAGATFIQLREKDISFEKFVEIAREIKKITDADKVPFVINDNVDVAIAINADGVHIGQNDEEILNVRKRLGQDKIIGLSAHTVEEAIKAEKNGADYIGVGAVFTTSTKLDANRVTHEKLKEICKAVTIPVVAIGGITKDNIAQLSGSGVDGVSVISAIFAQTDIGKATKELLQLSKQMVQE